jgi:2-polyprenyl-3-methyl-5-hydroxy-6-metoxy-1,4-benzoquinol methylase
MSLNPENILRTGLAFWASRTLLTAVEMELFTHVAKQPGDEAALRKRLGLHPRSSADFLDALVALGFLTRTDGVYRNAPDVDLFLDKAKPSYIGGILEMASRRLYGFWGQLPTALRTGQRQNESKDGKDEWAVLYADPARLKQFLHAMSGISRGSNRAIATRFPWSTYKTYVDVGTAQGDLAVQIAQANAHLRGTGFDLPQVEPIFKEFVAENKLADRIKFAAGSFFTDAIPKADVVLMGHILHDWNLEQKKMLLRKAYEALPRGGAVIVYDSVIDDNRSQNAFGLLMSLNMLIETEGGFDYTGGDCMAWMKEAGFTQTRVEHLEGPDSMVIGIK